MRIKIIYFRKSGTNYVYDFNYEANPGDSSTGSYGNLSVSQPSSPTDANIEQTLRQDAVNVVNNNFSPTIAATLADSSIFVPQTLQDQINNAAAKRTIFKSTVSGGSGVASFSLVDGSGNALYSTLTTDQIVPSVDGVADQYAFTSITVSGDKKTVTVTAQRQNFATGNVLTTLLGAVVTAVTGVTYVNAANGIAVKINVSI